MHHEFFNQLTEELLVSAPVVSDREAFERSLQELAAEFDISDLTNQLQEAQARMALRSAALEEAYDTMV